MATPATPAHHGYAAHETDFQTPIVDGALLEGHKENIAPTRDGRSATALSQIFSVPRAQRTRELANARTTYYRLLAEADEDPDPYGDPLDAYAQFVKWTVDNYPSGTSSESGLLELLDRATSKFCDDIRYKNDMRYHKLWRLYATFVEHPHRIYGFMLSKDIGTMYAAVYEEYALALERDGK